MPPKAVSKTRLVSAPTRRKRADVRAIKDAIIAALEVDRPMTVRQVFYRLVGLGVIDKTENEYKNTVGRLLVEMRRAREVPFGWIADNTRWMRRPPSHASLESALKHTAEAYRRNVWDNQGVYVEVWLEKEALAGVLYEETARWGVPLMVTRGYPSLTYLTEAAEAIGAVGRPTHLYYFGDYDPSGLDITRAVEEGIREFAPKADLTFRRVAVNRDQIAEFHLPTRPTKPTDSRSRNFEGESVEVDAIMPRQLRSMAEACITAHIDPALYRSMKLAEHAERQTLQDMAAYLRDRGSWPAGEGLGRGGEADRC